MRIHRAGAGTAGQAAAAAAAGSTTGETLLPWGSGFQDIGARAACAGTASQAAAATAADGRSGACGRAVC